MERMTDARMPDWALKLGASAVASIVFFGALNYAAAHPRNASAPLRPPVAAVAASTEPEPSPSFGEAAPLFPFLTLGSGVRTTTHPPVTRSHVS